MKTLLAAIILLLSTGAAHADDWTAEDTAMQLTYATVHCLDWLQTREIARTPSMHETNPILGRYPHNDKIDGYFATTLLAHTAISYLLPADARTIWQGVWIALEAGTVARNYSLGVRLYF